MVTAGTYGKEHFFRYSGSLDVLTQTLLDQTAECNWMLDAWAVFSNHYHFIGSPGDKARQLPDLVRRIHSSTARHVNLRDQSVDRRVWFQYWDTTLTYEASYLARIKYVQQNPVRHGLVSVADQYPYCSAALFAQRAPAELQRRLLGFRIDKVNVTDPYDSVWIE